MFLKGPLTLLLLLGYNAIIYHLSKTSVLIEHDRLSVVVMSYFCHHKINKLLTRLMIQVSHTYVLFGLLLPTKSLGLENCIT